MRTAGISAMALALAVAGWTGTATAQVRTTPTGKLFFEGDIVRHAIEGQQGPFCVLQNQFKRGEAVAWRIRVQNPDGTVADDKVLKGVEIELGDGQKLKAEYRGHGMPPTDYFWSSHWDVPANFPTGSLGYKVHATMQDGTVVTWEPFNREQTQLTVVAGEPALAPPSNP
jgi:hypothetical protein